MDPNLVRQLTLERAARTGEFTRHQQEVEAYQKVKQRFDRTSRKLINDLQKSIANLKKYQQDCVKNNLAPEIRKVTIATPLLKQRPPQEIVSSLDIMRNTINRIGKHREECQEETQANFDMYNDVTAQVELLQELIPEEYIKIAFHIDQLRRQLAQTLDMALQSINTETLKAKDYILAYFTELDRVVRESGLLFDYSEFTSKYNRVKQTYFSVFGEELPVDIQFTMDTSRDELLALQLATQM